jgi:hypothetical protein
MNLGPRALQARIAACRWLVMAGTAMRRAQLLALMLAAALTGLAAPASAQILYWSSGAPPIYAIQALRNFIPASSFLTLPPGLTWTSLPFVGPPSGTALISFQPPSGDSFSCNHPQPTATVSGNFVSGFVFSCSASAITVEVFFGSAATPTPGTVTLGAFSIAGTSPGLATLANYTLGKPLQLNCTTLIPSCELTASVTASSNASIANQGFGGILATIMAQSASEFISFSTAAPANGQTGPACVDLFSFANDGMAFQQPCLASEGNVVQVVDLGSVDLGETHYLGANGTSPFQWVGGGTVSLTGSCGGLMLEDTGSVPASCGFLPLSGAAAFLIPASSLATVACPATLTAAQGSPGAIAATITPPAAIFANVPHSDPTATPLYGSAHSDFEICVYASGAATVGDSAGWNATASFDCGPPASGICTALGEPAGPDALLALGYNGQITSFNFTNGGFSQIAFLRIVNRMNDIAPTDTVNGACLNDSGIAGGGSGRFVKGGVPPASGTGNFTSGDEVVPGLSGATTSLLDPSQTCQPVAQVVCNVTSDDGYNGYAALFTNDSSNEFAGAPGLLSGTNVLYPIYQIFQLAGIPIFADAYNVFNYGSMVCYAPFGVTLTQVQMGFQGPPLVNMQ